MPVSAMTLCATSRPAAPSVATPAAPPPFILQLSAKTSRAGGVSAANGTDLAGQRSPYWRAGPRSTFSKPKRG